MSMNPEGRWPQPVRFPDVTGSSTGEEKKSEAIPYSVAAQMRGDTFVLREFNHPGALEHAVRTELADLPPEITNALYDAKTYLPSRLREYLFIFLKNEGVARDFAAAFVKCAPPLLKSEKDAEKRATDVIGTKFTDAMMWWTFAPYLYKNMVAKGVAAEVAMEQILNWAKSSPLSAGGQPEGKILGQINLAGLEIFNQEGIDRYVLPRNQDDITHKFTEQEAERIVTTVFGIVSSASDGPRAEHQERVETGPEFGLNQWKYSPDSLNAFIGEISAGKSELKVELESAFREGGGKAFGLKICDLIASNFRTVRGNYSERDDLEVPKWAIMKESSALIPTPRKILRSSYQNEDWVDPGSGVGESFKFEHGQNSRRFEKLKARGELPNTPYILQDLAHGFGTVLDIAYSSVYQRVIARLAYGNARMSGYSLSSATNDTEAGVAVWDAVTGESLLPARNFFYPSLLEAGAKDANPFVCELYRAVRETGIRFGIQAELIMGSRNTAKQVRQSLVQIRPSPENVRREIALPTSEASNTQSGELVAETAVVNGIFDFTGEVHFFGAEGLDDNDDLGRENNLNIRLGGGKVGVYDRGAGRYRRLHEPGYAANIYLGGYIRGADVQITTEAMRPNSIHGVMGRPEQTEKYNFIDAHCGMVSIRRTEMERIEEMAQDASKPPKIRVISDGLVARVYLLKD